MTDQHLVSSLASLIKKATVAARSAGFRQDFEKRLADGLESGALSTESARLLRTVCDCIERWTSPTALPGFEAQSEWMELFRQRHQGVPCVVLEAMLDRMPSSDRRLDWTAVVMSTEKVLLKSLLSRRLVSTADLKDIAKANPTDFYSSAGLDVLVEMRKPCPRAVWEGFAEGIPRPGELTPPAELLVRCFAADKSKDAAKWMVAFLVRATIPRDAILACLLWHAQASLRLAIQLLSEFPATGGKRFRLSDDAGVSLLKDTLKACDQAFAARGETAGTASLLLGLLRIAFVADSRVPSSGVGKALLSASGSAMEDAAILALTRAESGGVAEAQDTAIVARGDELYRAVQRYIKQLQAGTGSGETVDRALRMESYLGRKELLVGIIGALREVADQTRLRNSLEAVLFNAGVREFGIPGARVLFDHHAHESAASGVLPGDEVVITHPGRRLGDEDDGSVIARAQVIPPTERAREPM